MSVINLIRNKYSISVIILVCCLLVDIVIHKGISRVIIPTGFTDKVKPIELPTCNTSLSIKEKNWLKAIDNIEALGELPANAPGIETDVYFDNKKNCFEVYHDSSATSTLNLDSLLSAYQEKGLHAGVWLDFKNLDANNALLSLRETIRLKNNYGLQGKMIIESSSPQYLRQFCDSGFYTSYYVPYFNPYKLPEAELVHFLDSTQQNIRKYPTSALSGYYFQYPVLKKFFPNYPILTWVDKNSASLVGFFFKKQLEYDNNIRIILYPH